jgi:GTP1/Obg family GTP-binding protein
MDGLTAEQQTLYHIFKEIPHARSSMHLVVSEFRKKNQQEAEKEHNVHSKMVSYGSRISGLEMVMKDHSTKIGTHSGKLENLEKILNSMNSLVQIDNENYARNLAHTKSVLSTVQKVNQDLCTDTEFLRHEMEKIHSTLREVPKIVDDIRKIKVQLSDLNLELVSLKTPKQESNCHTWLFVVAIVLSVIIGLYGQHKNNYLMIGH